ncbi:unnamed protein product [Hermetia illucens]|uniref:Uncharacterized protein n=1 Tax=Hermetia illucens TaxID=343691 RepID=A0A7R8UP64_HERIL|nr:uncharacterized protein LOC119651931 [Hermetia illucens]CAD7084447.1 unnamed protein product [Hermetia illucens]
MKIFMICFAILGCLLVATTSSSISLRSAPVVSSTLVRNDHIGGGSIVVERPYEVAPPLIDNRFRPIPLVYSGILPFNYPNYPYASLYPYSLYYTQHSLTALK